MGNKSKRIGKMIFEVIIGMVLVCGVVIFFKTFLIGSFTIFLSYYIVYGSPDLLKVKYLKISYGVDVDYICGKCFNDSIVSYIIDHFKNKEVSWDTLKK